MLEYALALSVFLAIHILPRVTGLRDRLAARFGERPYRLAYSALSLALLAWVVAAAVSAPQVSLWTPRPIAYWLPIAVMPISLILLMAGFLAPNPLSIALRSDGYDPRQPGIVALTRHPILWGFGLWAASHVPANGDLVAVTLFGGMAAFAFAGMAGVEKRARRTLGNAWLRLAEPTALAPRIPVALPVRSWLDRNTILGGALGIAIYAGLLGGLHLWAFGADPLVGL